jgi:uncharacterized protein (TIGR01244 family)
MRQFLIAGIGLAFAAAATAADVPAGAPNGTPAPSYRQVTDEFFLGAQPTSEELEQLKARGVRAVINLREPDEHDAAAEEAIAKALDLRYVNLPVKTADPKPEQADALRKLLADPANRPALLHCGTANRAAGFWLVHRVLDDGVGLADAEAEAKAFGLKSPNLLEFARAYIAAHPAKQR